MDEDVRAAIQRLRNALIVEWSHPEYHQYQMERLQREWPTLYLAIWDLISLEAKPGTL